MSIEAEVHQSPFFKMQWNVPKTVFRLAHRTCMEPHKAGLLGHCQNMKGPLLLYTLESRVVVVQGPQKRWLHLPTAQCVAKERKPFTAVQSQPGVFHHKQWEQDILSKRVLSSSATSSGPPSEKKEDPDPLQDRSISLYQRFKKTFRQYGKVLIPVHLITSAVWFGTFYYAAMKLQRLHGTL